MLHPDLPSLEEVSKFLKETGYELKQYTYGNKVCGCAVSAIEIMLAKKYPEKIPDTSIYHDRVYLPYIIGHAKMMLIANGFDESRIDPSEANQEYYDYGRSFQSLLPQSDYTAPTNPLTGEVL